ncbi:MAG: SprT family zinc-dependent metalloprotease [Bacteroidota bacterium]
MKIFLLDDFEIKIYKSHLAKKISISIRTNGTIRITIPKYASYLEAERFALQKRDWIFTNLKKFEEHSSQEPFTTASGFITKNHKLVLIPHDQDGAAVRVHNGIISVMYNEQQNNNQAELKDAINKGVQIALKKEALEYLPLRIYELSVKHKLIYNYISIRNMKTRWGSCSSSNKITLNSHLMTLPNHLIDYVLLHELVHTIIKNHSCRFWTSLESVCPNPKILNKELKNYKVLKINTEHPIAKKC